MFWDVNVTDRFQSVSGSLDVISPDGSSASLEKILDEANQPVNGSHEILELRKYVTWL